MSTLIVKHFASYVTDDMLKLHFSIFGRIDRLNVIKDNENSKQFGYITYEERDSAKKAIEFYNGKSVLGATSLYVAFARSNGGHRGQESFGSGNLFIKNLDPNIDEERLKQEFSLLGEILSVKILRNKENKSECRGFVCYKSVEDATRAIIVMNRKKIGNRIINIEFAKSVNQQDAIFRATYVKQMLNIGLQFQLANNALLPDFLGCSMTGLPMKPSLRNSYGGGNLQNQFPIPTTSTNKPINKNNKKRNNKRKPNINNSLKNLSIDETIDNTSTEEKNEDDGKENESNLFSGVLKKLSEPEQKKLLHQLLLPQIERLYPSYGEKLLKILIRLKVSELLNMFEDSTLLQAKVSGIINMMKSRAENVISDSTAREANDVENNDIEENNTEDNETENNDSEDNDTENNDTENNDSDDNIEANDTDNDIIEAENAEPVAGTSSSRFAFD